MDFNKTENIKTHDQLKNLIKQYKHFIETSEGVPPSFLDEFMYLMPYDGEKTIYEEYNWIGRTKKEIEDEEKRVKDAADLLVEYKSNPEKWRTEVIKPWSSQKLQEWIDLTYVRPLEFPLSETEQQEREDKRIELLEYHNQIIYTDNPSKSEKPSYIK